MGHKFEILHQNMQAGWAKFYHYLVRGIYYGLMPSLIFYGMFIQQPASPWGQQLLILLGLVEDNSADMFGAPPPGYGGGY